MKLKKLGIEDYQIRTFKKNMLLDLLKLSKALGRSIFSFILAIPGLIMTIPLGLLVEILSERERLKALANSKVKILGKDVVASYKILSSFIIVPFAITIYTCMFLVGIRRFAFGKKHQFKLSLLFFFCWPIYVYFMIKSVDNFVLNAKSVKSKVLFLLFQRKYEELIKDRVKLQEEVRRMEG